MRLGLRDDISGGQGPDPIKSCLPPFRAGIVSALRGSRSVTMRRAWLHRGVAAAIVVVIAQGQAIANDTHRIRDEIQAVIDKTAEATQTKNIEAFMEEVPPDFQLKQDDGSTMDRDGLRAHVLQEWSIIDHTESLAIKIERIDIIDPDEASVWTSQRWRRVMMGRDGVSKHNVLTTEKHKEHWRMRDGLWYCYGIQELGGKIWVDGKPFIEKPK